MIILAALALLFVFRQFTIDLKVLEHVKLKCLNPIGQTPHSAIFKLDVKGKLPDSASNFSVDFNDEVLVKLKKNSFRNDLVNHYYEVPGRYYPLLYYKDKLIDTGYVFLQTQGWTATGFIWHDTTRVYPILKPGIAQNKAQNVSALDAFKAGVDTNRTFFIHYDNIKPTQINGDDFELSVNITSSADRPGVRCAQADIIIFGEKDKHFLGLIKPECVIWNSYQFSEVHKDGEKDDLRALGYDLSKGAEVKLRVEKRNVKVIINSREIYKTKYIQSIGKIMGVEVFFSGIGHFENLRITDLKTGELF